MANKRKGKGRKKAYYTRQIGISARNKQALQARRAKRLGKWIAKGVNKKGKPVLSLEARAARAVVRKMERDARRTNERNRRKETKAHWENSKSSFNRGGKSRSKPPKVDED